MKCIKKSVKVLFSSAAIVGLLITATTGSNPGDVAASSSASTDYRNIIGIEVVSPTAAQKAISGCKVDGALVSAVIPKHPADTAGVKVGDIIIKIGDINVDSHSKAIEVINSLTPGRSYPFNVCRLENNGTKETVVNVLIEEVQENKIAKIS